MIITNMRMTSFRLSDDALGVVRGYRASAEFSAAWDQLRSRWLERDRRRKPYFQLPYAALAQVLCVLSGDLVCCQRSARDGEYIILSRQALDIDDLRRALAAWELCLGEPESGALSNLVETLEQCRILVSSVVQRRPRSSPLVDAAGRWPWDVAHWEVAHRLAGTALEVGEGYRVDLRLDSDGQLLTWSDLVGSARDGYQAMHVIAPKIITIPGVEEPVVHLRASLVRLADDWDMARPAKAWAEIPQHSIILRGWVRREKSDEDGSWSTLWRDHTAEILARSVLDGPPDPLHAPPSPTGPLRAGFRKSPRYSSVGRGVGPWFYEHIAHHARAALPDARPLEMTLIKSPRRSVERLAPAVSIASMPMRLRIMCIYHDASTRRRQLEGLIAVLGEGLRELRDYNDGSIFAHDLVEVVFLRPPHSERLVERGDESTWEPWVNSWLPQFESENAAMAAFVETHESAAAGARRSEDPKHALRSIFARRGIVSQFISKGSVRVPTRFCPNPEDYAPNNATLDLLRSAGWFLKVFPAEGIPAGTLIVGIYCASATRKTTGKRTVYLANLVAARAGENVALGYVPRRGWGSLHGATATFLGSEQSNTKEAAARLVEQAIAQLRVAYRGCPMILVFNAEGCRGHWPSLADKHTGETLPGWMTREDSAVVRIRTMSDEVPRAAGVGDWLTPASARYTEHRVLRIDDAQGASPAFLFSGSKTMSRDITQRGHTRFSCKQIKLKEDWHALRTTEIHVVEPGMFEAEDVEIELASTCRVGPSWEGQLRWPSPLHLARAVVRDHPHCVIEGEDDVDLSADD